MNENLKNLILTIESNIKKLPAEDYVVKFLDIYDLAQTLHPKECEAALESMGLTKEYSLWADEARKLMETSDSFGLVPETKEMKVVLGDEELSYPLVDVRTYLKETLGLQEGTAEFILALSFISKLNNFELFQLANAIILS